MKLKKARWNQIRAWMYRNARPLDLARFQFHFEGGRPEAVISALSAYQNPDGGFGHALEADCWNPDSSPIQTWSATQCLTEIGFREKDHPMIRGILDYLESGRDQQEGFWLAAVPGNNQAPHAPWWSYTETVREDWGYNPTASLAGFILCWEEPGVPGYAMAEATARRAAADLLAGKTKQGDMHELNCFLDLYHFCLQSGRNDLVDLDDLKKALCARAKKTICAEEKEWAGGYVCRPSNLFLSPESFLYPENRGAADRESQFILDTLEKDATWPLTWNWGAYPEAWPVSENWWKADLIIRNALYLKNFGCLE